MALHDAVNDSGSDESRLRHDFPKRGKPFSPWPPGTWFTAELLDWADYEIVPKKHRSNERNQTLARSIAWLWINKPDEMTELDWCRDMQRRFGTARSFSTIRRLKHEGLALIPEYARPRRP